MKQFAAHSEETRKVIRHIRPPSARPAFLVYTLSAANTGHTYKLPPNEPAVAPGDGKVVDIRRAFAEKSVYSDDAYRTRNTITVVIDHGALITTGVYGLGSVGVRKGDLVKRGQIIGMPLLDEVHFKAFHHGSEIDPVSLNRHFVSQDGGRVIGYGQKVFNAPDMVERPKLSNVITQLINGVRYFISLVAPAPLLLSLDFNGNGNRTGSAYTGEIGDYWNVINPVNFDVIESAGYAYCYGYYLSAIPRMFSAPPYLVLRNKAGRRTPVILERVTTNGESGSTDSWDEMFKTWVGGYSGTAPVQTQFNIRGLPEGNYQIILYSNNTMGSFTTSFYVGVNGGPQELKINNLIPDPEFNPDIDREYVLGRNCVSFAKAVPEGGVVNVNVYGYLAGMQIVQV
jgi:hypothetical protein